MTDPFFDRFRTAVARLPAGLIRPMPPARPTDIAAAEAALGRTLPDIFASFLRSFDGADLFHETVVIAGVGRAAPRRLTELPPLADHPDELVFAEGLSGVVLSLDAEGRVVRNDVGAEERAIAGSTFDRWLGATIAREQVLFGPDGEYAPDVFDPSGQEVLPHIALRQAERALKVDPGAAADEHARGLALARLGRGDAAREAFAAATTLDPENPWPWFDLGRATLELGHPGEAVEAFARAAAGEPGPTGARLLAWATRAAAAAGDAPRAATLRAEAVARDPALVEGLVRAVKAAATAEEGAGDGDGEDEDGDDAAAQESASRRALAAVEEARALLEAVAPGAAPPPRRRLRVIQDRPEPVPVPRSEPKPSPPPRKKLPKPSAERASSPPPRASSKPRPRRPAR